MNAPLLMELPLYSGQLSWEWDHSKWALQTHSPLPDIHSKLSMEWGSATGFKLALEPSREARTRETWGKSNEKKNFFFFLIKGQLFLLAQSGFLSEVMFTPRGQSLGLIYSEMHPKSTTDSQRLSAERTKWGCFVKMWWLPLWQPFCDLEEEPMELHMHQCEALILQSLWTNASY